MHLNEFLHVGGVGVVVLKIGESQFRLLHGFVLVGLSVVDEQHLILVDLVLHQYDNATQCAFEMPTHKDSKTSAVVLMDRFDFLKIGLVFLCLVLRLNI
jgi:hypothetical protein